MSISALAPMISRRTAAWLAFLMVASALTEGLGLIMLVPILSVLGSTGESHLPEWLGETGVTPTLELLLGLFVALIAVRALIKQAQLLATQRFQLILVDTLRQRTWHALLHCDWRVLLGLRRSDSASLLIGEVERIGYGVQQAISAIGIVITLAGILLAALAISPMVTFAAALCGGLILFGYGGLRRRANLLGESLSRAYADTYSALAEGLLALRVIKSLDGEDRAEAETMAALEAMRRAQTDYVRDRGIGQAALQLGGAIALALLVWLAVRRWGLGATAILPMVALFARTLPLLGALQETWLAWRHAEPALDATLALLARAEAAREPDDQGLPAPALHRELRLKGVSVQFEGADTEALAGIDLEFPAGQIIALSGPSGAGKSTLADLTGGLISADQGTLSIDGTVIDPVLRRSWRRRVAYVQQDPVLLSASLRDNLTWGQDGYDDTRIAEALRAAAAEFALSLPLGLNTRLGDGGRTLSGGERQRLMLARALLRDPALLILDEATSALDAESEAAIGAALSNLRGKMTILIIAHRGVLGQLADRSYRLENGRLVS